jgi:pilus assembly protein CpaC
VRAKAGVSIACFSALCLALSAVQDLRAQAPQAGGTSFQDSSNELSVAVGKTVLVDCVRPTTRVAIGLGGVAEATAISPTEIMVNGKLAGETSLIIWDDRGGRQFFNVTVRASAAALDSSMEAVRRELSTELPGQAVKVSTENGVVYLRGAVKDMISVSRAVQIASTAGKVVNLLNVDTPAAKPEILLKVKFASVDRNKAKNLGINLFNLGLGNAVGGISTGQFSPPFVAQGTGTFSGDGNGATVTNEENFTAFFPGLNAGVTIAALQTQGISEVLAEPNIVAMDGKEASFLAGGEYPYPTVQGTTNGSGAITIMFKEYGVRLNFIPTIMPNGNIRLQVAPEVSALDFGDAVEVSGFQVPAITTRKVNTEVELGDGETFVIGGLLDNRETETFEKIPFLGDIPILGKFFQSKATNRTNTELIVLVTPEIVAPIAASAAVPALKYPAKFLPQNSNIPMNTPDVKTAANTPGAAPASIPVEKMVDSMKPERPLVVESSSGQFGGASTSQPGSGGGGGMPAVSSSGISGNGP